VLFGFGNCIGTLRFSNGDTYTGEFNYGKPNGKGSFAYANGDSYSGTVAEGQRHGSGTYISAAGDKYVGQFNEGKFEGVGTYYFLANNRSRGDVYAGEFSSNTFNGQGRYTHSNGQVFVGSFVNGRKAVPIVAPETLLAQAEVQRLAEENAKQKAQLESQLEAEKREQLVREKQGAAVLVAQAEAQRIAEENAKQKAQLESQLEAERRELLAREKQAAAALVAKQDVQVAPIASPALAIVVVSAGDKAAPQPEAVLTKLEPVPASVETAQQLYGSQDSAVQAPQAAESRTEEQVTAYGERSKWYVTGGLGTSNSYSIVTGCKSPSCSTSANDLGVMIGFGKDLTKNIGIEANLYSLGTSTSQWTSSSEKLKNDYYLFTLGATFSKEITKKINLNAGGGYYISLVNSTYTSSTLNTNKDYQYDSSFVHLGALYEIDGFASIGIKLKRFTSRYYSITDPDGVYGYEIALKYSIY